MPFIRRNRKGKKSIEEKPKDSQSSVIETETSARIPYDKLVLQRKKIL